MITSGPEIDQFVFEPGIEIEPFDPKLKKEIFLNHPYKILLYFLNKHPPNYSRWKDEDINDFYFKMLDDYKIDMELVLDVKINFFLIIIYM